MRKIGLVHFRRQSESNGGFGRIGYQEARFDGEGQHGAAGAVAGAHDTRGLTAREFATEQGLAQKKKNAIGFRSNLGVDDVNVVLNAPFEVVQVEQLLHEGDLVGHHAQCELAEIPERAFAETPATVMRARAAALLVGIGMTGSIAAFVIILPIYLPIRYMLNNSILKNGDF